MVGARRALKMARVRGAQMEFVEIKVRSVRPAQLNLGVGGAAESHLIRAVEWHDCRCFFCHLLTNLTGNQPHLRVSYVAAAWKRWCRLRWTLDTVQSSLLCMFWNSLRTSPFGQTARAGAALASC